MARVAGVWEGRRRLTLAWRKTERRLLPKAASFLSFIAASLLLTLRAAAFAPRGKRQHRASFLHALRCAPPSCLRTFCAPLNVLAGMP
jgi:hypothetical protein